MLMLNDKHLFNTDQISSFEIDLFEKLSFCLGLIGRMFLTKTRLSSGGELQLIYDQQCQI